MADQEILDMATRRVLGRTGAHRSIARHALKDRLSPHLAGQITAEYGYLSALQEAAQIVRRLDNIADGKIKGRLLL